MKKNSSFFKIRVMAPLGLWIAILGVAINSLALPKMDLSTHNLVIEKLTMGLDVAEDKHSQTALWLRLGDLHSERARLFSLASGEAEKEQEQQDFLAKASADRNKAINYYTKALPFVNNRNAAPVVVQLAHLYGLQDRVQKAIELFESIIKKRSIFKTYIVGEAYAGLGDIYFRLSDFKKAKIYFLSALNYQIKNKAYTRYRLAWCLFNEGKIESAMVQMLSLLKQPATIPSSLKKDVITDLTTFTARTKLTQNSLNDFIRAIGQSERKERLRFLALESERLGNATAAILVWGKYNELPEVEYKEKLEVKMGIAQSAWNQRQYETSLKSYADLYKDLKKKGCSWDEFCQSLYAKSKSYILAWIKKEKSAPTAKLAGALDYYIGFHKEGEFTLWSGHIARVLKRNKQANSYYTLAVEQLAVELVDKNLDSVVKARKQKNLQQALLLAIETAEALNENKLKVAAYENYLKYSPNGKESGEVKYQLAYTYYGQKKYKESSEIFDDLAEGKSGLSETQRIKSADLSLDAIALTNDLDKVSAVAKKYANQFPNKKADYLNVSRRAEVNKAYKLYDKGKGNHFQREEALKVLAGVSLYGASEKEKVEILKNKLAVAESLKELDKVNQTADEILKIETLSSADKEFALSKKLWVAELRLDYKKAHALASKMNFKSLSNDSRYLKLAVTSELAGDYNKRFYELYIEATPSLNGANSIRVKLVRESKNPWALIAKYREKLLRTPQDYAEALFAAYSIQPDLKQLNKYLFYKTINNTAEKAFLAKYILLDQFNRFIQPLSQLKLRTRSDKQLKGSFEIRLAELEKAQVFLRKATSSRGFVEQMIIFNRVAYEYSRFAQEIESLPAPRNLNPSQRAQYESALKQQALPYRNLAKSLKSERKELISDSKYLKELFQLAQAKKGKERDLVNSEFVLISKIAVGAPRGLAKDYLAELKDLPGAKAVMKGRHKVAQDPFDLDELKQLMELESKSGSDTLSAVLEARIRDLEKEKM